MTWLDMAVRRAKVTPEPSPMVSRAEFEALKNQLGAAMKRLAVIERRPIAVTIEQPPVLPTPKLKSVQLEPAERQPFKLGKVLLSDVQREVCDFYGINVTEFMEPTNRKIVAQRRHVAMYLAYWLTPFGYTVIAQRLGKKDHTTVFNGKIKVEKILLDNEGEIAGDVNRLAINLGAAEAWPRDEEKVHQATQEQTLGSDTRDSFSEARE